MSTGVKHLKCTDGPGCGRSLATIFGDDIIFEGSRHLTSIETQFAYCNMCVSIRLPTSERHHEISVRANIPSAAAATKPFPAMNAAGQRERSISPKKLDAMTSSLNKAFAAAAATVPLPFTLPSSWQLRGKRLHCGWCAAMSASALW